MIFDSSRFRQILFIIAILALLPKPQSLSQSNVSVEKDKKISEFLVDRLPVTIDGELIATEAASGSVYRAGERIFHQKFGYGSIARIDGNKLTVDFEKAGRKKVVDSFIERH